MTSADSAPAFEFSGGAFGAFESDPDALRFGLAYRWRPMGSWALAPAIGVTVAGDGSNFVYADVRREFWLDPHWVVSLNFGAGRFREGEALHLGGDVQFQSTIGLARSFDNGWRVGTAVQHLSNGGLFDENPGAEVALLLISFPVGSRPPVGSPQSASVGSEIADGSESVGASGRGGDSENATRSSATARSDTVASASSSSRRMSSPARAR